MLPHPDTVRRISVLHDQERLRDVAQQHRAASSKAGSRSRPTTLWSSPLAGGSCLTGWMTRVRGAGIAAGPWRRALRAPRGLMLPIAGSRCVP
jgi:hypothetical protein